MSPISLLYPNTPQTLSNQVLEIFKDQRSLLLLLQEMHDGILICDGNKQVLLFNKAFQRYFNVKQPIEETLQCGDMIDNREFETNIDTVLKNGKSITRELILSRDSLKLYFQVHVIPLVGIEGVEGCVAIFHDLTAIRQTEKMRRDFVAHVSHELRTPLSAIHGYAETLLDGALEDKTTAWDFINIIFRHTTRLSQLVSDLLDLSKLESPGFEPEREPLDLKALILRVHSVVESHAHGKELTLFIHIPENLPPVFANASDLEQVLINLFDNAVKYTPEGGKIAVSAFAAENNKIEVSVSDTGIGIAAKHLPRLFERFYRVDKARSREMGGTGLGLSIVKHIIQSHGGDIWVESQPDVGSTFRFTLEKASPSPLKNVS